MMIWDLPAEYPIVFGFLKNKILPASEPLYCERHLYWAAAHEISFSSQPSPCRGICSKKWSICFAVSPLELLQVSQCRAPPPPPAASSPTGWPPPSPATRPSTSPLSKVISI